MSSFFGTYSCLCFSAIIRLRIFVIIVLLGVISPLAGTAFAQSNQNISTLQSIKDRGYFTWGADAEGGAPYVFVNPDNPNELIGYEVDIANEIASRLGVKAVMKQNAWDALVPALTRKDFDIILNGLEITPPRLEEISFTKPYYVYSEQMVVRADENRIGTFFDLRDKTVGTLSASVGMTMLQDLGGVNIKVYPGVVEPYRDLADKRLDAVVLDLPIAIYYARPNPQLKFVGDPSGEGFYGIGIRKQDTELLEKLNQIISDMVATGATERIAKKWNIWTKAQSRIEEYKANSVFGSKKKSTWQQLGTYLPLLFQGAWVTVKLSVVAMILAVALGLFIAIVKLYSPAPIRFLAGAYIEVIRGTPLLIQLYLIYYGLPNIGIQLDAFTAAVAGLALNYSAYEAENYRAGIQSIPVGQMEAALALGMTRIMALRKIIIPQAFKIVLPPVSNDFIALFKDSSLVSVITMVELTKVYGYLSATSYDYIGLGLLTAAIYFMMSYPASLFARSLEKKMSYGRK